MAVHRELKLVIDDKIVAIEPIEQGQGPILTINRINEEISLVPSSISNVPSKRIFGIFGTIRLNSGIHLIVITQAEKIGQLMGKDIYRVKSTDIHRLSKEKSLSPADAEDDATYLAMLRSVLQIGFFYFSYDFDITHNMQALYDMDPKWKASPLYRMVDSRFYWNRYLQKDFIEKAESGDAGVAKFILPIMLGFIEIRPSTMESRKFDYVLITRRSTRRAGTRYNTRGIDDEGNVANFNETEQIIFDKEQNGYTSYVQTRGSVPVFWRQEINVKYTPKLIAESADNSVNQFKIHFEEQNRLYGSNILVNLINSKGYEERVKKAFEDAVKKADLPEIKYVYFDFHHECRDMKFHKVSVLVDRISEDLDKQGFFAVKDGNGISRQTSVVRTNCMDCLDRTNVVQSVLARRALKKQLYKLGITNELSKIEDNTAFEFMLKNIWADNADAVSLVYSGTGALKTDYTRTGKRTLMGNVQDGVNSAIRYVKNNFFDGFRQDAIDLFLGNYRIKPGHPSPFASSENTDKAVRTRVIPALFFLALFMLIASLFIPTALLTTKLIYLVFWGVIAFICIQTITKNYSDFVNSPKLYDPIVGKKAR